MPKTAIGRGRQLVARRARVGDRKPGTVVSRIVLAAVVALAAAMAGIVVAQPASAAGDYGPDTCLQGYVWRDAKPGDHVCVLPGTRTQAATDNRLAASRRSPVGGPYGPDTCRQGYVWRDAFPNDHVCVLPGTRTQAAEDNRQAANRRASLNIWLTNWYPGPSCNGDTCSSTSTDSIPRLKVNGDHFNGGKVRIVVWRASDNRVLASRDITANLRPGFVGGSFGSQTDVFRCTNGPRSYTRAYDYVSQRWSSPAYFNTCNAVL